MVARWVGTALSSFMSLLTITLAYLTGALCFAIYTCSKSLGGWLYISIKIANLTNYLICGYGVGLAMVGYWIGGDELMETLDEAKSGNFISNPYSWLVGVGAIMVFQSLLGLIGLCVSENCDGRCKWMVRFYNYTLWIDLLANVVSRATMCCIWVAFFQRVQAMIVMRTGHPRHGGAARLGAGGQLVLQRVRDRRGL